MNKQIKGILILNGTLKGRWCNLGATEIANGFAWTEYKGKTNTQRTFRISAVHVKEARNCSDVLVSDKVYQVHRHRTTTFARSFMYRAIKLWNDLPNSIRDLEFSLDKFKSEIANDIGSKRIHVPQENTVYYVL